MTLQTGDDRIPVVTVITSVRTRFAQQLSNRSVLNKLDATDTLTNIESLTQIGEEQKRS
jgi:hypothetical protein